jgi:single-strand DNA-binding protein
MRMTNQCRIEGNLGANPVLRGEHEKTGKIVGFSIADNVRGLNPETKQYENVDTHWFPVTAFGSLAERVLSNLKKGERVAIQGTIKNSVYTDKDGENRYSFEIIASDVKRVEFLAGVEREASEADAGVAL